MNYLKKLELFIHTSHICAALFFMKMHLKGLFNEMKSNNECLIQKEKKIRFVCTYLITEYMVGFALFRSSIIYVYVHIKSGHFISQ